MAGGGGPDGPTVDDMATDPELGDLDNVGRTILERVAIRRVEIDDVAGAIPLLAELNSRTWQGSIPWPDVPAS